MSDAKGSVVKRQPSQNPPSDTLADAVVYDDQTRTWQVIRKRPLIDLLRDSAKLRACIIFTKIQNCVHNDHLREEVSYYFPHTPQLFWSKTGIDHNGFFGCHETVDPLSSSPPDTLLLPEAHSTYFRLIVKLLTLQDPQGRTSPNGVIPYRWYEMAFLSSNSLATNVLLCFDVPDTLITGLQNSLSTNADDITGPYALHVPLLDELIKLYDQSIWDVAKTVRRIEKERAADSLTRTNSGLNPVSAADAAKSTGNFEFMFEISRHVAHSVETTQIAAEVVERMKLDCESLAMQAPGRLSARSRRLSFLHSMLRGISARSISNEKRLASEQTLLSNVISQRDSEVNRNLSFFSSEIALAMKADGAAMKTIALVTLTFLPATFVTALLGMNFFDFDPDSHGGHTTFSKDLWLYFVIAVPLTTAVLLIWWWWQRRTEKKANQSIRAHQQDAESALVLFKSITS